MPTAAPVWSVCSDPLLGVDVSHWQGTAIDWPALRALGVGWAVCKGWHGAGVVRAGAVQHAAASAAGVPLCGRYAWWLPDADPAAQLAAWTAGGVGELGELPLTIDVEEVASRARGALLLAALERLIERVTERLGVRPILYTGDWYWRSHFGDLDSGLVAECPLWLAAYPRKAASGLRYREALVEVCGGARPAVPRPWAARGLGPVLWQFDGDGGLVLPSAGADVDVNTADAARLRALAAELAPPPPREGLSDLSLSSPATPLRAGEGEHTVTTAEGDPLA